MAEDYQTVACPFCGWAEATKDYEMLMVCLDTSQSQTPW
jgi:RNA polymerase subunit RPABC4/transcription elongation factor Spt4